MGLETLFAVSAGMQAVSTIGQGFQARSNAKIMANQYGLQERQLEEQKNILARQYRTKRQLLTGTLMTRAANNGVKVSGSVADSLSQSLLETELEESYQKYNISMEQINARYKAKASKIEGRYALINSIIDAGTTALSNYATYDYYWGSGGIGNTTQTTKTAPIPKQRPV